MAVISTHKIEKHFYMFRFISVGAYYDIEILEMPSYGKRLSDLSITHRIPVKKDDCK
jgi:hypothetical protein